jgi:Ca2+-binding EF-hand superfamily protein
MTMTLRIHMAIALVLLIGATTLNAQAQDRNQIQENLQKQEREAQGDQQAQAVPGGADDENRCEIPWTQVDTDGDGYVSDQEMSQDVTVRFNVIDTDGNDRVTRAEYVYCMTGALGNMNVAEIERDEGAFAQADINSDGVIDLNEFRQASQQAFQDAQSEDAGPQDFLVLQRYVFLTPNDAQNELKLDSITEDEAAGRSAATFNQLDQDGTGSINPSEWAEKSPEAGMNKEVAVRRFSALDADSSGDITREEFLNGFAGRLEESETHAEDSEQQAAASDEPSGQKGAPVYLYRFLTY